MKGFPNDVIVLRFRKQMLLRTVGVVGIIEDMYCFIIRNGLAYFDCCLHASDIQLAFEHKPEHEGKTVDWKETSVGGKLAEFGND
jgi:hypothetical protein